MLVANVRFLISVNVDENTARTFVRIIRVNVTKTDPNTCRPTEKYKQDNSAGTNTKIRTTNTGNNQIQYTKVQSAIRPYDYRVQSTKLSGLLENIHALLMERYCGFRVASQYFFFVL